MAIREAARVQRARRHLAYHIFTRAAVKAHPGTLFVVRVRLSYGDVAETREGPRPSRAEHRAGGRAGPRIGVWGCGGPSPRAARNRWTGK
jgi:hypothetical protein